MGPKASVIVACIRRRNFGRRDADTQEYVETETEIGVMPSTSQAIPRIASKPWKLCGGKNSSGGLPRESARLAASVQTSASRTVKEDVSVVLSHPVCGALVREAPSVSSSVSLPCCQVAGQPRDRWGGVQFALL